MKESKRHRGSRGVATILVVGVVGVFLIFFLVVGIDFAYIYVVRGQVQNAADAAALAGAALITDPQDVVQFDARDEAKLFTGKNTAAGEAVVVVTDNTNILSDGNDITVGFWDGSTYKRGWEPVNAVEVRPRRTEGSPGGPVGLFFGHLVDWPVMGVSRIAVAARPGVAEVPLMLCIDSCDPGIVNSSGSVFFWQTPESEKDPAKKSRATAFTNFSLKSSVNAKTVVPFFCGATFRGCNQEVNTEQAGEPPVQWQFRCAFLNPLYDSGNKECATPTKKCTQQTDKVISWSPVIPIVSECPPGKQGKSEPYEVVAYARAKIIDVRIQDKGSPGKADNCACDALLVNQPYTPTYPEIKDVKEGALIINAIECVDCPEAQVKFLGRRSFLVR